MRAPPWVVPDLAVPVEHGGRGRRSCAGGMAEAAGLRTIALGSQASFPSLGGTQELQKRLGHPRGVESGGRAVSGPRWWRAAGGPGGRGFEVRGQCEGHDCVGGALRGRSQGLEPCGGLAGRVSNPLMPAAGGASTSSPRTRELICPRRRGSARLPPPPLPGVPCAFRRESSRAGASTRPGEAGSDLTQPFLPRSSSPKDTALLLT